MSGPDGYAQPAVAGSGTIACGLAACATQLGEVRLLARSDASAWRAEETSQAEAKKLDGGFPDRVKVTTDPQDLARCDLVVEAIAEDAEAKSELLSTLAEASPEADLATTTSALPLAELAESGSVTGRLFGLHVFNPVTRMELVELCLPDGVADEVAGRAHEWCRALGKTAIEVPDQPGFVVNGLLFPFLFDSVRLMERTGMSASDIDSCMRLGAGHPMGPLRLLDFVGLDVATAIGESLHEASGAEIDRVPERIRALVAEGKLGRKSGAGFYTYD
ncbi:MAG: 3-hydroxyacyl-CoA dehydrogenase family protein [Solirubrobacterales bacterium]